MRTVFYFSLVLNFLFIACAATKTPVTTWIVAGNQLEHKTPTQDQVMTLAQAAGMRCYSEDDDLIIRDRMALCCGKAGL
jgi:hypothetical protein